MIKFKYITNRRFKFCSNYNLKLYKKFLSTKLSIYYNECSFKNLQANSIDSNRLISKIKILFYNRKEIAPLRILRYFAFFDSKKLKDLNVNKIYTSNLSVHNGKKLKPINIYRGSLELVVKCRYKLGDFILTRSPHFFRKKKK